MAADKSDPKLDKFDPASLTRHGKPRGPAPVHLWDPPYCGDIDMRIASDGTWFHEGKPIRRQAMVQLFSSILKKEKNNFYLVTPVEKVGIQVEDQPFLAVGLESDGNGKEAVLQFTLNTGESVTADASHRIHVQINPTSGEPHPCLHVRDGLEALLARTVFYQLVEIAVPDQADEDAESGLIGVWSCGEYFPLGSY